MPTTNFPVWTENAAHSLRGNGTWAAPVPAGVIVMWGGLVSAIPSGWVLCDGQNGTPDLRSKFVKGAAAGVDPGTTGGSTSHSHTTGTYAVADHAAHTHAVTSNVAVAAHTFTQPTIAWPASVPTFTGNSVAAASSGAAPKLFTANTSTGVTANTTATGTVAWPASVPTASGGAVSAHSVTNNAVTSGAPSAALSHSLSGTSDTVNHEPTFYSLCFIQKT